MPNLDPHKDGMGVTCPTCQGMGWIRLKTVGERLRHVRQMRGLSLVKLGSLAGVSGTMLHKIEQGTRELTVRDLAKLARALKTSQSWLLGEQNADAQADQGR